MTAVTREDGSYELLVDDPGRFFARVQTLDGRITYPSREVEIPDADSHVLNLDFAGLPVAGVVVDAEAEQPIPQASVFASPKKPDGPRGSSATAGADGRFYLEIEPGEYRLSGRAEGYAGQVADLTVGSGGASEVRLTLARGLSLTGKVVDARGRGIGDLFVTAPSGDGGPGTSTESTMTLPDGSFQFAGLVQRTYNLYVSSDLSGFALRAGASPGERDVVLTLRPGGRVRLQVQGPDGGPVEGAFANIEKVAGLVVSGIGRMVTTDPQGIVEVAAPAGPVEFQIRKNRLRGKITVSVPEGGTVPAEVKLEAPPPGGAP